jgi:hypothetical protein
MKCPGCGYEQVEGRMDCEACGLVFEKWRQNYPDLAALSEVPAQTSESSAPSIESTDLYLVQHLQKFRLGILGWISAFFFIVAIITGLISAFFGYKYSDIIFSLISVPAAGLCVFFLALKITLNPSINKKAKPLYINILCGISVTLIGASIFFYFKLVNAGVNFLGLYFATIPAFVLGLFLLVFIYYLKKDN